MYLLDGVEVGYEECIRRIIEALEDDEPVSHAYHQGVDCYWIEAEHPWYARPVALTDSGVEVGGKILESVLAC